MTSEAYFLSEADSNIQANLEDSVVQEALHSGVDLREYSKQGVFIDKSLHILPQWRGTLQLAVSSAATPIRSYCTYSLFMCQDKNENQSFGLFWT